MAIQDPAMGFVPKTMPKFYSTFKVAADAAAKIYKFAPISIDGGYAIPSDVTPAAIGGVMGIAMHHVDATPGEVKELTVCTDPDVIYEVNGDTAGVITDVGGWVLLKTVAGNDANDLSTATVDLPALTSPTAETNFKVVGISQTVTNASTTNKVLVKMVGGAWESGFDLDTDT